MSEDVGISTDKLVQLSAIDGALPSWANWLLLLGKAAVQSADSSTRLWICVTLPTRSMAAPLIASGVAMSSNWVPPPTEGRLEKLENGDWFTYVDYHGTLRCAEFKEVDRPTGEVKYRRWDHDGFSPIARRADRFVGLWPLPNGTERFAKPKALADSLEFTLAALGTTVDALACSKLVAVVVGNRRELLDELQSTEFAVGQHAGALADLVRPRCSRTSGRPFRSEIIAASRERLEGSTRATVAIFDGPQGFVRLRCDVEADVVVLVTSRTAPRAEEAVQQFMLERATRSRCDASLQSLAVPDAVELQAWVEDR